MKTFEQFRRELADAVTVAINSGVTVGDESSVSRGCRCPLGIKTSQSHPIDWVAGRVWEIPEERAGDFIRGFDGDEPYRRTKFFQLGRLYRQRFVEGR